MIIREYIQDDMESIIRIMFMQGIYTSVLDSSSLELFRVAFV